MKNVVYKQTYTDKDGNEKVFWNKCGRVITTKNGEFIKLDHIPVNFNGWFSLFEEDKTEGGAWEQQREKFAVKKDTVLEDITDDIDLSSIPF